MTFKDNLPPSGTHPHPLGARRFLSPAYWRTLSRRRLALLALVALGAALALVRHTRSQPILAQHETQPLFAVKARYLQAQQRPRVYALHGTAQPTLHVTLQAQTRGTVVSCPAPEGSWVEAGTPLVELSLEGQDHELQRAQAAVHERSIQYEATLKLADQGYASARLVAEHLRDLNQARSAFDLAQSQLEKTCVRAPFAGVWNTRAVQVGDAVSPGTVLGTCLDPRVLKVSGYVHSTVAPYLSVGLPVQVSLMEQAPGSPLSLRTGQLSYVSAQAHPTTHLYRVEAQVANPHRDWPAGALVGLELAYHTQSVHTVLPAWLSLIGPGQVGLYTVDEEGTVVSHPVQLVGSGPEGILVSGLPQQCWVITRGQGFVTPGQRVTVVCDDSADVHPFQQAPGQGETL